MHRKVRSISTATEAINSYSFAQVREKLLVGKKLSPERIDEAIVEFRKYLTLIAQGHQSVAMTSRDVDEVWHTFILFTKDYASFCEQAFGFFLHHQPSLPSQPIDPASRDRFVAAYHEHFGELPTIWAGSPTDGCCGEQCAPTPSCSGEPAPTYKQTAAL